MKTSSRATGGRGPSPASPKFRSQRKGVTRAKALRLEAFAREYLVDHDAGRAAQAVGYAAGSGHALAKHPTVRARLAQLAEQQAQRLDIRADAVLAELWRVAMLPDLELRGGDKLKALELLAKHFRLLEPEQGQVQVAAGAVQVLIQAVGGGAPLPARGVGLEGVAPPLMEAGVGLGEAEASTTQAPNLPITQPPNQVTPTPEDPCDP